MKIAVISDIHANLEAFKAVIADAQGQNVDRFLCLGDIVGYGPDPGACVDLVQSLDCAIVRGNHDHDAANDRELDNLNDIAKTSLQWTRGQLSAEHKEWLGNLPFTKRVGRFAISHATPHRPNLFTYVTNLAEAQACLDEQSAPLCFIGHTHVPGVFVSKDEVAREIQGQSVAIDFDAKTLVNVGSVGQPRDGDPRACYVIYDVNEQSVNFRRIKYAIEKTKQKLLDLGLPTYLATRLTIAA